eukprot:4375197-Pleurochrysis_carterae.AAC.1
MMDAEKTSKRQGGAHEQELRFKHSENDWCRDPHARKNNHVRAFKRRQRRAFVSEPCRSAKLSSHASKEQDCPLSFSRAARLHRTPRETPSLALSRRQIGVSSPLRREHDERVRGRQPEEREAGPERGQVGRRQLGRRLRLQLQRRLVVAARKSRLRNTRATGTHCEHVCVSWAREAHARGEAQALRDVEQRGNSQVVNRVASVDSSSQSTSLSAQ